MQALAATGDAPLPEPWSEGRLASGSHSRFYFAAREGGGQVSTRNRIDAINASNYIKEHPGTSIVDALVTVVKERNDLPGLEVVGTSVRIDASHDIDATLSP